MKLKDILLYLILLYVFCVSIFNFSFIYVFSAMVLIIAVILYDLKNKSFKWNFYLSFQMIFIIYELLFIFLGKSIDKNISFNALKTFLFNFSISFAFCNILNDKKQIKKFLTSFCKLSVIIIIIIILITGGSGQDGRLAHNMPRPFSSTGFTAIEVGMIAVWGSICLLFYFYESRKKSILFLLLFFILIIVWSGSRECYVFGMISILLMYFFNGSSSFISKLKKTFVILFVSFGLALLVVKIPTFYNMIGYRFVGYIKGTETSAISRDIMGETAKKMIIKNYVFGYGLDTFRTFNGSLGTWSHNNYLEMMVSGGIILTLIYYIPLIILFIKLININGNSWKNLKFVGLTFLFLKLLHDIVAVTYLSRMSNIFIIIPVLIVIAHTSEKKKSIDNIRAIKNNC